MQERTNKTRQEEYNKLVWWKNDLKEKVAKAGDSLEPAAKELKLAREQEEADERLFNRINSIVLGKSDLAGISCFFVFSLAGCLSGRLLCRCLSCDGRGVAASVG